MNTLPPIFVRTTVSSPVHLAGTADVFEAQFNVDVTRDNRVLETHTIMASAGTGTRGTWNISIPLSAGKYILVFYSVSMKDGSHENEVRLPILVK